MQFQFIGVLFALTAAISWGSGDFTGGYASRRMNQYPVLFLTSIGSLSILILMAIWLGESLPNWLNLFYAILAGILGALGLAALYQGLSIGNPAIVAPVAGIIGALFPMFVGIIAQGPPGKSQLLGFGLAFAGIWLVTRLKDNQDQESKRSLETAILAGLGFGGFLALIAQVDSREIFTPLLAAKLSSLITAVVLVRRTNQSLPRITNNPIALVSGVLDAGGNVFYLYATHYARLDVVAILASLYPIWTVLLSYTVLKKQVLSMQWIGIFVCIIAIILITM